MARTPKASRFLIRKAIGKGAKEGSEAAIEYATNQGRLKGNKIAKKAAKKAQKTAIAEAFDKGVNEARGVSDPEIVSKAIQFEQAAQARNAFVGSDGVTYMRKGDAKSGYTYYSKDKGAKEWTNMGDEGASIFDTQHKQFVLDQTALGEQLDLEEAYKIATEGPGDHAGFDLGQAIQNHPVIAMGVAAGGGILAANLFDDDDY